MSPTLMRLMDTTSDAHLLDLPCRTDNPDDWFSTSQTKMAKSKKACAGCPTRQACLRAALDNKTKHGIWGGLDPQERQQLIRGSQIPEVAA